MTDSPLQTETQDDAATFEHFDHLWTVPTSRHLSHFVAIRDGLERPGAGYNLVVAETFLSVADWAELLKIDPDEAALNEFVDKIAGAMGLKGSGNS